MIVRNTGGKTVSVSLSSCFDTKQQTLPERKKGREREKHNEKDKLIHCVFPHIRCGAAELRPTSNPKRARLTPCGSGSWSPWCSSVPTIASPA
jgi:hypothetical protein